MASPLPPFTLKQYSSLQSLNSPLSSSSPSPTPYSGGPRGGGGGGGAAPSNTELSLARKWIEECTGCVEKNKSFKEYLQDGIVLCELVKGVRPDLIKKIRRVKSPFAWRENLSFFVEACKSLGLKGSQLFSPEDLISSGARTPTIKSKGFRGENERRLRNVAITIFWLSRAIGRLPDYSGPLLEFDLSSFGVWDPSDKVLGSEGDSQSPTLESTALPTALSQSSPLINHSSSSPSPSPSPPRSESKNSSPSLSPPLPISPYQSPTIRVKRVDTQLPQRHTDSPSSPQIIVHVGGRCGQHHSGSSPSSSTHSRSNSLSDIRSAETSYSLTKREKARSTPALDAFRSIHTQLSESEKVLSDLTRELTRDQEALAAKLKRAKDVSSIENSTNETPSEVVYSTDRKSEEKEEEEEGGGGGIEESDSVSLGELIHTELLLNSRKSPVVDIARSPSVSSSAPSEVSTIVPRDQVPSRCSALSLPEENPAAVSGHKSPSLLQEHKPTLHVPLATATPPRSPVTVDPEGFTNPLSNSSPDNSRDYPEDYHYIEHNGDCSPEVDVDAIISTELLSLGGDSVEEEEEEKPVDYPSLSVSSPPALDPAGRGNTHHLTQHIPGENHHVISDEAEPGEENDQTTDLLTVSPQFVRRTHPAVSALKEDTRNSFHSSCSSLDSTACSVIEVSYCYRSTAGETESLSPTTSQHTDNTDASYCSSSSDHNTDELNTNEVVPAETLDHYLATLESPDLENTSKIISNNNLTRYHSLPNFEQADLEPIPEEMAVTTQVMRIYPAQSVGEISSGVSVPHHRVHIPSSSSSSVIDDRPQSPTDTTPRANGGTAGNAVVCVSPSTPTPLDEPEIKVINVSVEEAEPPTLMATAAVAIVEDGEDEEEEDDEVGSSQPVGRKNRKISRGKVPETVIFKPNFNLTPVPVGGSFARVQSDALPLTLHADMLTLPDPSGGGEDNNRVEKELSSYKDELSDFNSIAVEIGSSIDSLSSSRVSVATSSSSSLIQSQKSVSASVVGSSVEPKIPGYGLAHHNKHQVDNDSFHTSDIHSERYGRESNVRPISAPTRATSDSVLPPASPSSVSSSPYVSDSNTLKIRNRRMSGGDKRQQRLANIAEGARAALTYTAIQRYKKTESLPRDQHLMHHWHSHSLSGSKSVSSEEELLGSSPSSVSVLEKGSGSISTAGIEGKSGSAGSPLGSLNLHSLSMDETRKASETEMEEIWKLVENESGTSSSTTSVDTTSEVTGAGGGGGGGGGRRLPSIALETHISPKHQTKTGKQCWEKKISEETDGGFTNGHDRELPNGNTGLDISQVEGLMKEVNQLPLHSTPKRPPPPEHRGPSPANLSLLTPSGTKQSPLGRKDLDSLLTTLRSLGREENEGMTDSDKGTGLKLLEQMLHSNTFKKAQKIHDTVQQLVSRDEGAPTPALRRVVPLTQEARHHLHHHTEPSPEVDELRSLLREPHLQALMFSHDRASSRDYYIPRRHYPRSKQDPVDIIISTSVLNFVPPSSSLDNSLPLSRDVPSSRKEDATIVYLQRTNRPLGCTIYKQGEAVFVGKLLKGCDAELSEVLREGDELLEVNGVPVIGRSTDEIVRLMSGEAGATLAFTIIPLHDDNIDLNFEPKYVRAHFNYSPITDEEIPCQPLGLRFEKGDILEISNQDDPDWWQARKVFDDGAESLPGLIPARHKQQQREAMTRSYPVAKAMEDQHRKKKGLMSKLSRKKKKTVLFYNQGSNQNLLSVGDEVVTYEDVARMDPHQHWRRPIILIGASGVGKGTLIRKLINSDHTHFAAVVQHTTRPTHPGEVNGHTYHFVTREEFELDILQERFLEYEEVKGHLYGTSVSATKKIVESGRVPVMDLQPQSLKRVRYSGLMPYVVFVASPRMERLVVTRRVGPERPSRRRTSSSSSYDMDSSSQIYTEPELQHLLVESRLIESQYSHYFDWIIVNDDLSVASDMLKEVARRAEEETQWVPASWMIDHSF